MSQNADLMYVDAAVRTLARQHARTPDEEQALSMLIEYQKTQRSENGYENGSALTFNVTDTEVRVYDPETAAATEMNFLDFLDWTAELQNGADTAGDDLVLGYELSAACLPAMEAALARLSERNRANGVTVPFDMSQRVIVEEVADHYMDVLFAWTDADEELAAARWRQQEMKAIAIVTGIQLTNANSRYEVVTDEELNSLAAVEAAMNEAHAAAEEKLEGVLRKFISSYIQD